MQIKEERGDVHCTQTATISNGQPFDSKQDSMAAKICRYNLVRFCQQSANKGSVKFQGFVFCPEIIKIKVFNDEKEGNIN